MGTKWKEASYALAATDLLTDYTSTNYWVTGWIDVGSATEACLQFTYVQDDATTVEMKIQTEQGADTDGFDVWRVSGSGVAALDEIQMPAADTTFSLFIECVSYKRFRVLAKHTGGTGDNSLAVEVLAGSH